MYIYVLSTGNSIRKEKIKKRLKTVNYEFFCRFPHGDSLSFNTWKTILKDEGFIYETIKKPDYVLSRLYSHLLNYIYILKDAVKNKRKDIIILEDDVVFNTSGMSHFLDKVPKDCNILLLYIVKEQKRYPFKEGIHKVNNFYGAQGILYRNPEILLDFMKKNNIIKSGYDRYLSKNRDELKIYYLYPFIVKHDLTLPTTVWNKNVKDYSHNLVSSPNSLSLSSR